MQIRHKYQELRHAGKLFGTIRRAEALWRARFDTRRGSTLAKPRTHALPLGTWDILTAGNMSHEQYPRRMNWDAPVATTERHDKGMAVKDVDHGAYSSRCTYRKISYTPAVTSYAAAFGSRLVARVWDKTYKYRAPHGYRFGTDSLGVYIQRKSETRGRFRYHLLSDEVRAGKAAMRAAVIKHTQTQIQADLAARQAASDFASQSKHHALAIKLGIWISIADSDKAGNCRAGAVTWGRKHNLTTKRHYPVALIARLAKTHYSVGRVIRAAKVRAVEDLIRGYCVID